MLILRLWYLLVGYLLVEITGPSGEKLINLASARGVFMWGVRRVDKRVLTAHVGIGGLRALRPLSKITGAGLRVEAKLGLPFVWRRLMYRKALVAGSLLSILAVWALSSFVWFIEVSGGETESKSESSAIRGILTREGVQVGSPKWRADYAAIQDDILAERSGLAWASVSVKGTLVKVEYVRKVLPDARAFDTSNVVAAKAGVITKLIPFTGQARASEGDTVQAGDILIEGRKAPTTVAEPGPPEEPPRVVEVPGQAVRARGLIEATVYYEGYGEACLRQVRTSYTGRARRAVTVRVLGRSLRIGKLAPYREYDAQTKRAFAPSWRNHRLPVEVLVTRFVETTTILVHVPRSTALARARASARRSAMAEVPKTAKVLRTEGQLVKPGGSTHVPSLEAGLVRYRVVVETREAIGIERRTPSAP